MHAASPAAYHPDRTVPVRCTRCPLVTYFAPGEPYSGHVCQACCDAEDRVKAVRSARGVRS